MIRRDGGRVVLSGPVTLANAAEVLREGSRHFAEGAATVDLAEVTEMDSTLLALTLAWLREARAAKRELAIANPPQALQTIARLYGVESFLSL